jgi:hypothetical protein
VATVRRNAALPTEDIGDYAASTRTVLIVVSDLREYPGSAVGDIATRTGLMNAR